jgi:hypothetical protein
MVEQQDCSTLEQVVAAAGLGLMECLHSWLTSAGGINWHCSPDCWVGAAGVWAGGDPPADVEECGPRDHAQVGSTQVSDQGA